MKFRLCEGNGVCFYYLGKQCVQLRLHFCVTSRNGSRLLVQVVHKRTTWQLQAHQVLH